MAILSTVLLVIFVIIAVLLVLLVLIQNEEGDSLGGIFAGGSGSAFGSRSGNVLTRITTVLGTLFLIISLGLALLNRTPGGAGVEAAGRELFGGAAATDWLDEELNPRPDFAESEIVFDDIFEEDGFEYETPEAGVFEAAVFETEIPETEAAE